MNFFYKNMLNIELWHDYYLGQPDPPALADGYNILKMLSLRPTLDCQQILRKLRWIFRPMPYGATLIAYVDQIDVDIFQLQIPISQPYRLTFWLVVHDDYFANFTNLPLTSTRNQIYYFSNLSDNRQDNTVFLSHPLQKYQVGSQYQLGDLLVSDQGEILEALQYEPSATQPPNLDRWQIHPGSPYVSGADLLPQQGLSYPYTLSNMNPGDQVAFSLVDANGQKCFEHEIIAPSNHPPGHALIGSLNFTGQEPGRYQLYRDRQPVANFVLVDPLKGEPGFALVEIVLNPVPGSPGFDLLQIKDNQPLQQPNQTYVIRFKNRSTRWRYRCHTDHGFCLPNPAPNASPCIPIDEQFIVIDPKTYVIKRPRGLLHRPKTLLKIGKRVLPDPDGALVKPIMAPATDTVPKHIGDIFSDVHL